MERILKALDSKRAEWSALSAQERAVLLRACIDTTLAVVREAGRAGERAKGSYGQGPAEEMQAWFPTISGLREYAEALEARGSPQPQNIRRRPDGQAVADVFPLGLESLLFGGFRGEVWIQPGQEPSQGSLYRSQEKGEAPESKGIGLVLGAGNQLSVASLDIVHKLIVDDEVVVCKMNPVNDYYGPFLRRAFQPLVDRGFVEFVYGAGEEGKFLCQHPLVCSIHLTGSAATYDAIVWQGKPKKGAPPCAKHVGAELGCVTPYIVVPGPWTEADLDYHADNLAAGKTHNAGHNCLAAELVVTDAEWELRDSFMAALRRKLDAAARRVAYYPHSDAKFREFKARFKNAEELGRLPDDGAGESATQPWLLQAGLSPAAADVQNEHWCGVLQEVAIPGCGGDAGKFLAKAVEFANSKAWGTLSCALCIHPQSQKEHAQAFDRAVADLRYGCIVVNGPTILGFAISKLTWGAFPGNTPESIGSGNCFVHNTMLFDHPQKSVLYAPWKFVPKPFWATDHHNLEKLTARALTFMGHPSLKNVLAAVPEALKG